ncbi:diguanylate cyclase [Vibrio sp. MACH09]|nr:diguanylate cyclase [Vibrio sp. MACH09]
MYMAQLSNITSFLEFLGDAVIVVNHSSDIVYVNSACAELFHYSESELSSMKLDALMPDVYANTHRLEVSNFIEARKPAKVMNKRNALPCIDANGQVFQAKVSIAFVEMDSQVYGFAIVQDYSQIQREINELQSEANTDPITGLANRRHLHQLLENEHFSSSLSSSFGVAYFDLDKFKSVNDLYGHHVGDVLLAKLGERLTNMLRADDYVFRVGGDEFLVIFRMANKSDYQYELESMSNKIHRLVSHPIYPDNGDVSITIKASIGMGIYPQDHGDLSTLITLADEAMYISKSLGVDFSMVEQLAEG